MRNISFALTTEQFRNRTKTVTRRLGWKRLKAGDRLRGCVKCMGLRKGESPEVLGEIEVVSVRREPLSAIVAEGQAGADREGFPAMGPRDFVRMFCEHMGGDEDQEVTRIEFRYVDDESKAI